MTPKLLTLALFVVALIPQATATSNTFTDPSGDTGLLGNSHFDILSWEIASNGTHVTQVLTMGDIDSSQRAVHYQTVLQNAHSQFQLRCSIGTNNILANALGELNNECAMDQYPWGGTTDVVALPGTTTHPAFTWSVDTTANTLTVTLSYSTLGLSSGDSLGVIVAGTASNNEFGSTQPIQGDELAVDGSVTLA